MFEILSFMFIKFAFCHIFSIKWRFVKLAVTNSLHEIQPKRKKRKQRISKQIRMNISEEKNMFKSKIF